MIGQIVNRIRRRRNYKKRLEKRLKDLEYDVKVLVRNADEERDREYLKLQHKLAWRIVCVDEQRWFMPEVRSHGLTATLEVVDRMLDVGYQRKHVAVFPNLNAQLKKKGKKK